MLLLMERHQIEVVHIVFTGGAPIVRSLPDASIICRTMQWGCAVT